MAGQPLEVLDATIGTEVSVQLKEGETHTGELKGYDQHMNLVIENGASKDTTVIRGDNVVSITV